MNIKEQIGRRITDARKAKQLTQAQLARLAGDFGQPRLNNWEKGIRTPGLEEVKQLAEVLNVSPAYLMCLTDVREGEVVDSPSVINLVPILNASQAMNAAAFIAGLKADHEGQMDFFPLSQETTAKVSKNCFALKMPDDSMAPEIHPQDVLIIEPVSEVKPGQLVLARVQDQALVRRYKQSSAYHPFEEFELVANNSSWANVQVKNLEQGKLIGAVVAFYRFLAK